MKKNTVFAAMAAAAMALTAGSAFAAQATASVNVRSGPGTNYSVVDTLFPGEQVGIRSCSGSWCLVDNQNGPDGYVSRTYLANDDDVYVPPSNNNPRPQPNVNLSFNVPGFSFSIGNGGGFTIGNPPRPGSADRVCFYEDWDYQGASFCARPGERLARLGQWNDRISSIRVFGDAEAQVCVDNNFNGRCVIVDRSVRNLGNAGNDRISSIRVR